MIYCPGENEITDIASNAESSASAEVINVTSDEESLHRPANIDVSSFIGRRVSTRVYKCRKCGLPKTLGGHGCPANDRSLEVTPSRPDQQKRTPRQASNLDNLPRLARYVEGDSSAGT